MGGYTNMKLDLNKYSNLTRDEFNGLVKVIARIFIGNNLVFYIIATKDWTGYILCKAYDEICKTFKVSIEDKNSIKRINFKVPNDFDINMIDYCGKSFKPTDTSKEDAYAIFPNGVFNYSPRNEHRIEFALKRTLNDYCSVKYADEIEADIKVQIKDETDKFVQSLKILPFVKIYDTFLEEVVGYVCVDTTKLNRFISDECTYSSFLNFSASDIDRLGYKLNVVDTVKLSPRLSFRVVRGNGMVLRTYSPILYNKYKMHVSFNQNRDGLCSTIPVKYADTLGINYSNFINCENIKELREEMEKARLDGNRWFNNNGNSFIRHSGTGGQKVDNRPRGKYGLIDMFKRD